MQTNQLAELVGHPSHCPVRVVVVVVCCCFVIAVSALQSVLVLWVPAVSGALESALQGIPVHRRRNLADGDRPRGRESVSRDSCLSTSFWVLEISLHQYHNLTDAPAPGTLATELAEATVAATELVEAAVAATELVVALQQECLSGAW